MAIGMRYFFSFILAAIVVLSTSCTDREKEQLPGGLKKTNKTVNVVAILPLTGKLSLIGEWHRKGFQIAEEESKNLKLLIEDNKSSPKESVIIFTKLTSEKNTPVVISAFSQLSKPIIPLSDKHEKYLFLTTVSVPDITKGHKTVYRYNINFKDEIKLIIQYLNSKKIANVSLLYINDEYGKLSSDYFIEIFKGNISFVSSFSNETNEKNLLAKLPSDKPVVLLGYGRKYLNILKGIASIESLKKNLIITNYSLAIPQWKNKLKNTGIKVIYTAPKIEKKHQIEKFFEIYERRYKEKPNLISVFSYDLLRIVDYFIKSNSLGKKIGDTIELPIYSAYGYKIKIGKDREIKVPIILKEEVL